MFVPATGSAPWTHMYSVIAGWCDRFYGFARAHRSTIAALSNHAQEG